MNSEEHITYTCMIDEEFVDLLLTVLNNPEDWRILTAVKKLKELKELINNEKTQKI